MAAFVESTVVRAAGVEATSGPVEGAAGPSENAASKAPQLSRYVVRAGDTVDAIAARYGISAQTITWVNHLANANLIRTGQVLQILSVDGAVHRVRDGETIGAIAETYGLSSEVVVAANRLADASAVRPETTLLLPNATRARPEESGSASVRAIGSPAEQAFIAAIVRPAQESQRVTGVPASVTIAQAILETYWGTSSLARDANNYFGIKAHRRGGTDGVVWIDAWEVENGQNVVRQEPFRKYNSVTDSLVDHGRFFHENSRYAHALESKSDAREFARRINTAGYATDPAYATKLVNLMERFALFDYDVH